MRVHNKWRQLYSLHAPLFRKRTERNETFVVALCACVCVCSLQITVDSVREEVWSVYDAGPRSVRCPLIFLPPVSSYSDIFYLQLISLASHGFRVIAVSHACMVLLCSSCFVLVPVLALVPMLVLVPVLLLMLRALPLFENKLGVGMKSSKKRKQGRQW